MANTREQRKRIEEDLYSHFTHPSPSLKKKWEKRRQKEGNGQGVLDQEFDEWMNEGKPLSNAEAKYKERLATNLWNDETFRQDVKKARKIYLENIKLPLSKQDEECLRQLNQELSDKYYLNLGWLIWLTHCIMKGENDPRKLMLYRDREEGKKVKHISLDVYFPLSSEIYDEAINYLRMRESEVFGDYYSQRQSGGRKTDKELYSLFKRWQADKFDPKKKKVYRQEYMDAHPKNGLAGVDFDEAMKRFKRKLKKGG